MKASEAQKLTPQNMIKLINDETRSIIEGIKRRVEHGHFFYDHNLSYSLYHIVPMVFHKIEQLGYDVELMNPQDKDGRGIIKYKTLMISWHPIK